MTGDLERVVRAPAASDLPQPVSVAPHRLGGLHAIWRFANGRGLSVVDTAFSYGIEGAVLGYHAEGADDFTLDDSTPLTPSGEPVIGYMDADQLIALLRQIRDLPPYRAAIEKGS